MTPYLLGLLALASPVPGDHVASFTLSTPEGAPWHWAPGKITVFTFCAFWCDTWKTELPRVQASNRATTGLPVDFVTVSVDGRWSGKAPLNNSEMLLNDPGSSLTRQLGIDRIPYTLVVDPSGTITWAGGGTQRSPELVKAVRDIQNGNSASGAPKTAYLTFDDFPTAKLSYELLDRLRALQVPATIFCICSHLQEQPLVVAQLKREGIVPQIHAWEHDKDNLQLDRCRDMLNVLGFPKPALYRPPGSETVYDLAGTARTYPVDDPYDYTHPGASEVARRVLLNVRDGSVIQLHSGVQDTLDALPEIVSNLRSRGFVLKSLVQGPS